MSSALEVFSDLSEKLHYNLPDFPLYVRKGTLRQFDRHAAACHWHPDLEFISVLDGSMEYFVNGQTVHIDTGTGIFVNSKRLHYGFSNNMTDCSYLVVTVHPALLGENTPAGKGYLGEKFGSVASDYLLLAPQSLWQREALLSLSRIYEEMYSDGCNLLRLLSQAASLCACVGDHVRQVSRDPVDDQSWMVIWKMTGFIHQHYDSKIALSDIASAGAVCRSRCCELFSRYVGQTPNTYLMRYRIQKSCEMLRETNRSVCEIAIACGFESASYFSYVFRRETGSAPQDYRRQTALA
jgi:AraC-type DNA-binding domain-containing proteins